MIRLQAVYDEVMPEYNRLASKKEQIEAEAKDLIADMEEAEANYNAEAIEEIGAKLKARKKVLDRLSKDIEEYRKEVNKNNVLKTRIDKILYAISEDTNEKLQDKFTELRELKEKASQEIAQLETEIYDQGKEIQDEVKGIVEGMKSMLPPENALKIIDRAPGKIMVYDKSTFN